MTFTVLRAVMFNYFAYLHLHECFFMSIWQISDGFCVIWLWKAEFFKFQRLQVRLLISLIILLIFYQSYEMEAIKLKSSLKVIKSFIQVVAGP